MATSSSLYYTLLALFIYQASAAPRPESTPPDPVCTTASLVAPGQGSLIYQYKTEVHLTAGNSQSDIKTEISADVHIKGLSNCGYVLQLRNVKVVESKEDKATTVGANGAAQKELENIVVRFRWVDGFIIGIEADSSAKVDHVNFIKGILSALQVFSPVPTDNRLTVREEDVLGVCTTDYKFSQKSGATTITKTKDLSTCSKDKLHLSSSPFLTSLLGPLMEEVYMVKTNYICKTEVSNKNVQSVKCKTVEVKPDDKDKLSEDDDDSSEEKDNDKSNEDDEEEEEEISPKMILIKQSLKLQTSGSVSIDERSVRNPVRQTLQFVPTASFDQSNAAVSSIVSKINELLKTDKWTEFASAEFVDIANELRRMDPSSINTFKSKSELKHLIPTFLNTIYAHDPATSLLNFDSQTFKFANPLAVFYLDKPTTELVTRIVTASRSLTAEQVPEFIGVAAKVLKTYKDRQDNVKDADAKIQEFQRYISRFLQYSPTENVQLVISILAAYAQLGLYDDQIRSLATNDELPLQLQYQVLNTIRNINDDYITDNDQSRIRSDLQTLLLTKLQNTNNKNAVRVWAFEALYTPFIYNPEEADSTLGDNLEKAFSDILNQPLDQVNGYMWSVLKYSSLNTLCPLRGLAARLRAHHDNKKQFNEQPTLSSRHIEVEFPLRKNFEAVFHLSVVFENDRAVPSFISVKLAADGVRRETLRLPWIDAALVIENLDWNFAEYFLRLDPLNKNKKFDDEEKNRTLNNLPSDLKDVHNKNTKEEDPDPSVFLFVKLFGADIRTKDITDEVQNLLLTNVRTFIRGRIMNRLKDLAGKNPIFRIPIEIGAASGAANGLTLYKAAQLACLADLTTDLKNDQDANGVGAYSITSRSVLSFSFTVQREVSSPLTTVGETLRVGILSNIPFQYTAVANDQGRTREFNLLNPSSKALSMDFQYATRMSQGFELIPNKQAAAIDPSCTPSNLFRSLGIRACATINPFRSVEIFKRPRYPMTITLIKDPSIQKWRVGWRFNAKDAPQYEVAIQKVGTTETYPGLGVSATITGNKFDIKFLTGIQYFTVKGSRTGEQYTGTVYGSDNKEVMTTSGKLSYNDNTFTMDGKFVDSSTKKEVLGLSTEITPNRGQGLVIKVGLETPEKTKSFKLYFRGNLYKPDSKLVHVNGAFTLGDLSYTGTVKFERDEKHARIELGRLFKPDKTSPASGYDFFYERKTTTDENQIGCDVNSHISLRTPMSADPMKVFNIKSTFSRKKDLSNAELHSGIDFVLMSRSPPVSEKIEIDYVRDSVRSKAAANRLLSPEASLKIEVKTKSQMFNFLLDHRHRRSADQSKKGPETLPPTFNVFNKIHIVADTDKLLPDIPRPFAFDISSDLDFELLNRASYKFQYNLPRRQRSGSFSYKNEFTNVTGGHLFSGASQFELEMDNKAKTATGKGTLQVCAKSRTLKAHWDIDTSVVADKNDATLDLNLRFDRQPVKESPKSFIGVYNIVFKAPKHEKIQLVDIDGSLTKQFGKFETFNSIAYRKGSTVKEANINVVVLRNNTGDGSLKTHLSVALPFKYVPYISHNFTLQRDSPNGRLRSFESTLLAKPVFSHHLDIDVDRSKDSERPYVSVLNEIEYLRANGNNLLGVSKIDIQRWSALHTMGILKRNTDLLHKHSIGYIISSKTRKVALSLINPLISQYPLSIIGELTYDKENRIFKNLLPQEFGVQLEFGTPISNLTGIHVFYNLPMFNENNEKSIDASMGLKIASTNIAPVAFYLHSEGSLNKRIHVLKSLQIGSDIALSTSLTAQYNPRLVSQISSTISGKYYGVEFGNSLFALFKKHRAVVRGIANTTDNQDFQYDLDIGFDDELLTGHMERPVDGVNTVSDIEAKKCNAVGKYYRCYTGDITVKSGGASSKGSFDVSWGRDTAKLAVKVPNHVEFNFDHTHNGRLRDADFNSNTNFNGKLLQANKKGAFSYSGSLEKENNKWNNVQIKSSLNDMKTGQKSFNADIRMNQKVTDKISGQFQRNVNVNLEREGSPVIVWSSQANSCPKNPSDVVTNLCETATFNLKASNKLVQRLRQRLELSADPQLAKQDGQVDYDGTLNLDVKMNPSLGPHTLKFDLNRRQQDAIDIDAKFQQRTSTIPMNIDVKASLPRRNPISIKYEETRRSETNYDGTLKYSFNANDASAEKTYQCNVDKPEATDFSINCNGERTTLVIDIDRKAGVSKAYVDLNRYAGERVGYELTRDRSTGQFDATLYTFVNAWNLRRQPQVSTVLSVKQKGAEVLNVEVTKRSDGLVEITTKPANIYFRLQYDKSGSVSLTQTYPEQRKVLTLTMDRARIRRYLPSLRNQNRPSQDIDDESATEQKPLFEIAFDNTVLISISQALFKFGSHNGLYGLDTVKKLFKLQIRDVPLTIYNVQHWKTHLENIQLPESYLIGIFNNANGNRVQLANNKWNENRLIATLSHSFDGGKSMITDVKLDRNYAHQVGRMYFFHSVGHKNIEGLKALRNYTHTVIGQTLIKDLDKTSAGILLKGFRTRVRSLLEKDYSAVKEIVTAWSKEPENSFLKRLTTRLELLEFFGKYPTYSEASDRIFATLRERIPQRQKFWHEQFDTIMSSNRLQDVSKRIEARRAELVQLLSERAEQFLERYVPAVDQTAVNARIDSYIKKLIGGFKKSSEGRAKIWKSIFKSIDDASQGEANKWFRTLIADIDSKKINAAIDAELQKVANKLEQSSPLIIRNVQEFSKRLNSRREAFRERVRNAVRNLPKFSINTTDFEVFIPIGRRPRTNTRASEMLLSIGSLLRNRDQAFDTIRSVIQNRLQSRFETYQNYFKALKAIAKRLFKRKPSLTPEFNAVIANTGDALDFHGHYIYLNPACTYVLSHDLGGLQFSFRFANGKFYSSIPNQDEIEQYECSKTGRVQLCNQGFYSTISLPMYYGGRADGVLGDVRDRIASEQKNFESWIIGQCPDKTSSSSKVSDESIPECYSDDDDEQLFCENFVQRGLQKGLDKRLLVAQALAATKYT